MHTHTHTNTKPGHENKCFHIPWGEKIYNKICSKTKSSKLITMSVVFKIKMLTKTTKPTSKRAASTLKIDSYKCLQIRITAGLPLERY